jgi:hypothetical protein
MSDAAEGDAKLSGGTLRFRLAGEGSGRCLVFENGLSAGRRCPMAKARRSRQRPG